MASPMGTLAQRHEALLRNGPNNSMWGWSGRSALLRWSSMQRQPLIHMVSLVNHINPGAKTKGCHERAGRLLGDPRVLLDTIRRCLFLNQGTCCITFFAVASLLMRPQGLLSLRHWL
mmetsp:Transcript_30692/g.59157  ORF Transcript_30692/g.59157 Transcript_30692/m.59157 type:complete len:117 (+) Transcript_30692:527-877(+)